MAASAAHPLAGASGEGPPVAPPDWKWRCGNRMSDMYFYAPGGKLFRSRTQLDAFLRTMPNGPSSDEFCWRITPEILETGVWTPGKCTPRRKHTSPRNKPDKVDPYKSPKKVKENETGYNWSSQTPPTPPPMNGRTFSQVEPLAIRAPGSGISKKVTSLTSRSKMKARRDMTDDTGNHSFKEVLSETSSFKWLYDTEALTKFLEEAAKLDELSRFEVRDLRNLLLARNVQVGNISKYPNSVLRVFVRLLGTHGLLEAPSTSLGKVELADLCVKLAKA